MVGTVSQVMELIITKMKEVKGKSKCDDCGAVFNNKDVKLKPLNPNFGMTPGFGVHIKLVEPDGTLVGVSSSYSAKPGSCTLHCPKCGDVHLFGFDQVEA